MKDILNRKKECYISDGTQYIERVIFTKMEKVFAVNVTFLYLCLSYLSLKDFHTNGP